MDCRYYEKHLIEELSARCPHLGPQNIQINYCLHGVNQEIKGRNDRVENGHGKDDNASIEIETT